jgi:hypothetical protein
MATTKTTADSFRINSRKICLYYCQRIVSIEDQLNQLSLKIKGVRAEEQENKKESGLT